MPTLNAPLPAHFYCLVRAEYLRNLESGYGELEEACVFGISSTPNRALGFHVHLKSGAIFWRLPIGALCWSADAPARKTNLLQAWDSFGYEVVVTAFPYLREREATVRMKDGTMGAGSYVCTIDWYENGYSDQPDQNKCAHLLRLDDGNFCAYPNNFLLWADSSFTAKERTFEGLQYRANTHVWYAEEALGAPPVDLGARAPATEDTDRMFYGTSVMEQVAEIALDGQPFGFTWEMVDALREEGHYMQSSESSTLAEMAIAIIESLLPPREP